MVGNPEVIPPIFRNQVLAPLPRVAPASQINFSGLPLNITAGLSVTRAQFREAPVKRLCRGQGLDASSDGGAGQENRGVI